MHFVFLTFNFALQENFSGFIATVHLFLATFSRTLWTKHQGRQCLELSSLPYLVQELLTIYISLPIKPNAYSSTQY